MQGDRFKEFAPLTADEHFDVLRAVIGYALSDEALDLSRMREKYAAKMAEGPDRHAFDVVTAPIGTSGTEFREVVRNVASLNTLDAFLREMQTRYPDKPAVAEAGQPAPPKPEAKADAAAAPVPAKPPAGTPVKTDNSPTGSISRMPQTRPRAAGTR